MNLVEKAQGFLKPLGDLFGPSTPNAVEGFRDILAETMPSCPVCKLPMTSHQYRRIACTAIGPDERQDFSAMMEAIQGHRWDDLNRFQNWQATSADADVYLFKCADGRYNLAVIYCPYELEGVYRIVHQEQIAPEDAPTSGESWLDV